MRHCLGLDVYESRFTAGAAAEEQQPDVSEPITGGATVCTCLDLECLGVFAEPTLTSFPCPSDAEKWPEGSWVVGLAPGLAEREQTLAVVSEPRLGN